MKRSVAILGPTPSFIRWAIWHPCSLRELDAGNLPDSTFRQLRAIRELSEGYNEDRVVEGFCIHPTASSSDIDSALGFSAEEILGFFGTKTDVDDCCSHCPANAAKNPPTWAGCYGWLATKDFAFAGSRESLSKSFDLIALIDEALARDSLSKLAHSFFEMTNPAWHGFWKSKIPSHEQLQFLLQVFERALVIASESETEVVLQRLNQFVNALTACVEYKLQIYIQHIPPGNSDGQTWEIDQHCPDCKVALSRAIRQTCYVCGRVGTPASGPKSRVLGLRPFMHLKGILGKENAQKLLEQYECDRK